MNIFLAHVQRWDEGLGMTAREGWPLPSVAMKHQLRRAGAAQLHGTLSGPLAPGPATSTPSSCIPPARPPHLPCCARLACAHLTTNE